jgi:hypothetical protein
LLGCRFIEKRHKFLRAQKPRNYAVYVRSIPIEYRNKFALYRFFQQCFHDNSIREVTFALKVPLLASKVAARDQVIVKLEHAVAIQDTSGVTPTHNPNLLPLSEQVDSIATYSGDVATLNVEITKAIEKLERRIAMEGTKKFSFRNWKSGSVSDFQSPRPRSEGLFEADIPSTIGVQQQKSGLISEGESATSNEKGFDQRQNDIENETAFSPNLDQSASSGVTQRLLGLQKMRSKASQTAVSSAKRMATSAIKMADTATSGALSLLKGPQDGEHHEAAFVTFSRLSTVHAALQMVHSPAPFSMEVLEAPDPDDGR